MATTINFDLSSSLVSTLESGGTGNGVYAYAFAFGTVTEGTPPVTTAGKLVATATLVYDGQIGGTGPAATQSSITLDGLTNGAVYVVIQQGGDGTLPNDIALIGDINTTSAQSSNYSYQLFEVSLDGSPNDLGDISALNTFGFGATMQVVFEGGGGDIRGMAGSANSIFSAVGSENVEAFGPGPDPSSSFIPPNPNNRLGIGPASDTTNFPTWTNYVNALAANPGALDDIVMVASYTGAGLTPTPMLSVYGVEYEASSDSFWLAPDITHGGTNTDWINIPSSVLAQNIYIQPTDLVVHQGSKTGPIVTVTGGGFTPNNAAGTVSRDFIAGFDAGYWGGTGTSPNPLDTTAINLNHSNNWNVNYAYNGTMNPGLVTYSNALSSHMYDPWAQAVQINANAYGWSYSDLVSAGGVNPQITLWDPTAGPFIPGTTTPEGAQVGTINIGLYANGEVPGSFQTAPSVYVAPPTGGYLPSLTMPTFDAPLGYASQIGFNFNFSASTLNFAPYLDTPIYFRIYVGQDSGVTNPVDADGFISLQVTAPNGDWYNYTVTVDEAGTTWSLVPGAEHTTAGSFSLYNLPTTATAGGTSWYQLEFGSPGNQTLYNLYGTSGDAPNVTDGLADLVVDRAVGLSTTAATSTTPTTYSLNFAPGGSPTYEIANVSARALHDINADGISDLIFQNTNGTVFAWEQSATGTIAAGQIGAPDPTWQAKYVADFYGDGGSDILFQNSATSEVFIWQQDGLSIATASSIGTPGLAWQVKGAADINGDTAADIIFQNSTTGDVFGWLQHGMSTNVGGAGTIGTPGTAWQVKGVANNFFSGANSAGIVLQNADTGDVNIWQLNEATPQSLAVLNNKTVGSPGVAWQVKGTGDFNGDGYADIVFQNSGSGDVAIWEQNGFSTIMSGTVGTPGTAWQVAGTGDFNGDGLTDLAFQNTTTGEIFEWQMNGLQITQGISLGDPGTAWHIV